MSGVVVVDASLVVKWLVREEDTDKALAIRSAWHDEDITPIAPYLMPFEVVNALHQKVLRGQLSVPDTARMISQLLDSQLELRETSTGLTSGPRPLPNLTTTPPPMSFRTERSAVRNLEPRPLSVIPPILVSLFSSASLPAK